MYNLASAGRTHLYRVIHGKLAHIGARPALLDGFIAETGLTVAAG
ncbi:hypothetical protein [Frankia sp. CiP3]|nr:hypothetical protein [Frankia sp. CiP3]